MACRWTDFVTVNALPRRRFAFAEPTFVGDHCFVRFHVRSKFRTGECHQSDATCWRYLRGTKVVMAVVLLPLQVSVTATSLLLLTVSETVGFLASKQVIAGAIVS